MSRKQSICTVVFFAVALTHAVLGFVDPSFPAWKMFIRVDCYAYVLQDGEGRRINFRDHLPQRAYTPGAQNSINVVMGWLDLDHPEGRPYEGDFKWFKDYREAEVFMAAHPDWD